MESTFINLEPTRGRRPPVGRAGPKDPPSFTGAKSKGMESLELLVRYITYITK